MDYIPPVIFVPGITGTYLRDEYPLPPDRVSEASTRIPAAPFWPAALLGSFVVFLAGGILIARRRSKYRFEMMADQYQRSMNFASALKRRRAHAACN
jgi:hypothetical protein